MKDDRDAAPDFESHENLKHFIAMLDFNSAALNEEEILDYLEMGIHFEGPEYLDELKADLENDMPFDYKSEGLDEKAFSMIKNIIKNYKRNPQ